MNRLKKALGKEDTSRYNKTTINFSGIKNSHQHTDIEYMLIKVSFYPLRRPRNNQAKLKKKTTSKKL